MSGDDSHFTPKKLRQASITELFGPFSRKRKSLPSASSSHTKKLSTVVMSNPTCNDVIDLSKEVNDSPPVDSNRISAGVSAQCSTDSPPKSGGSNKNLRGANLNHNKERTGDAALMHKSKKSGNEEKESSQGLSQDSQDLLDIVMAEKREANNRLLKKEVEDDYELSQNTPPPNKKPEPKKEPTKPEKEELMMYDSPDMFDTYPTPEFDDLEMEEEEDVPLKWMGMPKSRLKTAPDCLLPLPQLQASQNHTVLFDTSFFDFGPPPPSKKSYFDTWDSDHVKLSCSPKSLFPVNGNLTSRWELIENSLLSNIKTSEHLEKAIKRYNVKFSQSFSALHTLLNKEYDATERSEFFSKTLPEMIKLALTLPTIITQPVPLLKRQQGHCLTMSQQQIACLLANAFFCTFPRRNSTNSNSEYKSYPTINFNRLLTGPTSDRKTAHVEKLKTIIHYFKKVTDDMPSGVVTFERRVCRDFPIWNKSPCELCGLHVRKDGLIEDEGKGMLQMDFANRFIGGGVLGSGLVQEEILFSIYPELLVSRLFTEVMDDNECVLITGAERFSKYSGYSSEYKWEGDFSDSNTRDTWRRKVSYIVALDATHTRKYDEQYKVGNIRRELNKLYCGFHGDPDHSPAIATGNWGCGAFGGDPVLKALLQMIAAAAVCRDICYMTHQDEKLMITIHEMHGFVTANKLGVGDLWNLICRYNVEEIMPAAKQKRPIVENIFEFMKRIHSSYDTSTDDEDCQMNS